MTDIQRKPDRRIAKTRKAIRNAFAKLLSEKDINHITIKDISDTADINRKTFYNYYSGVYQIIDEIENDIVTLFDATINDIDLSNGMKNPCEIFDKLTEIISSDIDFYSHLMKADRNVSLVSKVVSSLKVKAKESLASRLSLDDNMLNLIVDYVFSGMLAVYQSWFNSDRKQPIESLSENVSIMTYGGIQGLIQSK